METLALLVNLIGHLAWPITIYMVIKLFHKEIRLFISRIKNAKYKGIEIDLERELRELKEDAEDAGITAEYKESAILNENLINMSAAPELVFIQSWQDIENTLKQLFEKTEGDKPQRGPMSYILAYLEKREILDSTMCDVIKKLMGIRNKIVHTSKTEITRGEALEWLGIAMSVSKHLKQKL